MFCKIFFIFTLFYGNLFEIQDRSPMLYYDKRNWGSSKIGLQQKLTDSKFKPYESKVDPKNLLPGYWLF